MGGGREQQEEAAAEVSKLGFSTSGDLPPSAPPHLQGQDPRQYQYGTFQPPPHHAAASGEFGRPPVGFPQPAPPPGFASGGAGGGHHHHHHQQQQPYAAAEPYYAQGYQAGPGYGPIVEGRPVRMHRLPCCGLGMGWLLFIAGFFLAAIPWYVGAFILICVRVHDYREKPGFVACTVAVRYTTEGTLK
uniref:60S ribosomal protein L18a-like protein n=1 Tax=Leersia perrieri TaxID=77586 RepID=A0A0D9WJS8_9ORYZ